MEVSVIISLISVCATVVFGIYSIYIGWKQRKIQDRLDRQQLQINAFTIERNRKEEENEKKANICAKLIHEKTSEKLVIVNKGLCDAHNIRTYLSGITEDEAKIKIHTHPESFPCLIQDESFEIHIWVFYGHVPSVTFKLVWDDQFGKNREKKQEISLF